MLLILGLVVLFSACSRGPEGESPAERAGERASAQGFKLPAGFVAIEAGALDPTGWPKQIRCEKDGAVMVFVAGAPGGPFYIDQHEVTNAGYRRFMGQQTSKVHHPGIRYNTDGYNIMPAGEWKFYDLWTDPQRSAADQPVTCVSVKDATAYAEWAGKSLPTKAQWRWAALGGDGRTFPWGWTYEVGDCKCAIEPPPAPATQPGETALGEALLAYLEAKFADTRAKKTRAIGRLLWHLPGAVREAREIMGELDREARKVELPAVVGSFPRDASGFGCYDMAGNVSEWVVERAQRGQWPASYVRIGGNAGSYSAEDLSRSLRQETYARPQLVGFRTILGVNRR